VSDILSSDTITQQLAQADDVLPGGVFVHDSLDSTNAWAMRRCREGAVTPFACVADSQTQGRGRRGRQWVSPPHSNIYLSLAWPFERAVNELGALPIVIGKAIVDVLHALGITDAVQKWPNDVLVNADKLAGILIETGNITTAGCTAVIGIGLNWRMPTATVIDTDSGWTDVSHCLQGRGVNDVPERNIFIASLLRACCDACRRYQQRGAALLSESQHMQALFSGQQVSVLLEGGQSVQGCVLGLTARGELRLRVDGGERVFNSADVSLRAM
jgi:BirA family transcriptional regulator, biotin operon repressor / biotin---[acetyl-CoA-carboxylase] ligase